MYVYSRKLRNYEAGFTQFKARYRKIALETKRTQELFAETKNNIKMEDFGLVKIVFSYFIQWGLFSYEVNTVETQYIKSQKIESILASFGPGANTGQSVPILRHSQIRA